MPWSRKFMWISPQFQWMASMFLCQSRTTGDARTSPHELLENTRKLPFPFNCALLLIFQADDVEYKLWCSAAIMLWNECSFPFGIFILNFRNKLISCELPCCSHMSVKIYPIPNQCGLNEVPVHTSLLPLKFLKGTWDVYQIAVPTHTPKTNKQKIDAASPW